MKENQTLLLSSRIKVGSPDLTLINSKYISIIDEKILCSDLKSKSNVILLRLSQNEKPRQRHGFEQFRTI